MATLFLGIFTSVNAQDIKKVRIGFKISPNFAWTHIMEGRMQSNGMGLGFSYGLMADFNIAKNPNYWLATEFIITSQPSSIKSQDPLHNSNIAPFNFTNVNFDYKLQYLQIPITLKLKTNEIGNLTYWGQFGFGPAVLIQNKVHTTATENYNANGSSNYSPNSSKNDQLDFDGDPNNNNKGAYKDNVSPVRLPLILGAGVEGKISGNTSFVAGLRFDNAFTDLFLDKVVKGRNNYLGIQLGIFF